MRPKISALEMEQALTTADDVGLLSMRSCGQVWLGRGQQVTPCPLEEPTLELEWENLCKLFREQRLETFPMKDTVFPVSYCH